MKTKTANTAEEIKPYTGNKLPTKFVVKTKSNFRKLNGKELILEEIAGTRVSARIPDKTPQGYSIVDFTLTEVIKFF